MRGDSASRQGACAMSDYDAYDTVTVQAAITGWVLTRKGYPTEIFTRWEALVSRLQYLLTSKGDQDNE